MAAVAGFYRRALPSPPAIEFASPEGKKFFSEALLEGNMEGFFKLVSYYQTQSEPPYCGLATLGVVLNALAIDPGRKWKGPWRWFNDSMLDTWIAVSLSRRLKLVVSHLAKLHAWLIAMEQKLMHSIPMKAP